MKILLTGGLGCIGLHACVELLQNNYEVVIIDNLSNTAKSVLDKIKIPKCQVVSPLVLQFNRYV
jgi:UDP-glucose 4-epimerase